jgi:hypothetical protein
MRLQEKFARMRVEPTTVMAESGPETIDNPGCLGSALIAEPGDTGKRLG